jgi:predicted nucleic acid-binding protein
MIHRWVLNASPLILLGKAELLKTIGPLADTWIVTNGVLQEVAVKSSVDLYLRDLSIGSQVLRVDVAEIDHFVASWDLGRGEGEVITVALSQPGTGTVLDDSHARKCAKILEIPLIGSVGLILRAKRENLIPLARPSIERLISVGLFIDSKTISQVLRAVGELPVH